MFALPDGSEPAVESLPLDELKLSNYLGILRENPTDSAAMAGLCELATSEDVARLGAEPVRLLQAARSGHEARGEWAAVEALLRAEQVLVAAEPQAEIHVLKALGEVRLTHLLDAQGAAEAYGRVQALGDDREADEALRRIEQAAGSWRKFVTRFLEEADSAVEVALKTSLLVRAAALVWQYESQGREEEAEALLRSALEVDPGHVRTAELLEHMLRVQERWQELCSVLVDAAEAAEDAEATRNFATRAARVFEGELGERDQAAACYAQVLEVDPADSEALGFLSKHFGDAQRWDDLASLYEAALQVRQRLEAEQALLLQAGMVHYRMREEPEAAEPYFARLRMLEPGHPAVLDFYRVFYGAPEDAEGLLAVLTDAQRVASEPDVRLALSVEIARRAQEHPHMTERSIDAWKLVLRLDPTHAEAAQVLKALYHKACKWNALVEVLRNEVDGLPDTEVARKVDLLRQLADVYDNHLRIDGMVINTYHAILRLDSEDKEVLGALRERYRAMGRWNDLIKVLTQEAENTPDKDQAVALYLEIARLWIDHISNQNQATLVLERVIDLQPTNQEALNWLKDIYRNKRAFRALFEVLRREREASADPQLRLENAALMARLSSERLQRHDEAIVLWREVVAEDPLFDGALDALGRLAERQKDYATQADVLERRLSVTAEPELRVRLLQKLGGLCGEHLGNPLRAREAFREILSLEPKHSRALRALRDSLLAEHDFAEVEALYGSLGDWEALVEVLGAEAERAEDPEQKVALSFQAARVYSDELRAPFRALRCYERVLQVDPSHRAANEAVLPIYEADEKWSRVVQVLLRLLESDDSADVELRLQRFARLVDLELSYLRDARAALDHSQQAFRLAPERPEVEAQLVRATEATGTHGELVSLYLEIAAGAESEEDELALGMRRRAAELAFTQLGNLQLAASEFRKVLAQCPDDLELLQVLEQVERERQQVDPLVEVLQWRLARSEDAEQRAALLRELAQFEEQQRNDPQAAAAHMRVLADLCPEDDGVWAELERLARSGERYEEVCEVLRARLRLAVTEQSKVDLGYRLAQQLLATGADEAAREEALHELLQVLTLRPAHQPTLTALEQLAAAHSHWAERIVPALEDSYEQTGQYDKLTAILERRLAEEQDAEVVQRLRLRVAEISGSKLGDASAAYAALEAAFLQQPFYQELWDRLTEVAALAGENEALAQAFGKALQAHADGQETGLADGDVEELARRAAHVYDEVLLQPGEAEAYHKRVLALQPLDDVAFEALKHLCASGERWDELQEMYRARVAATLDPYAKVDLLLQSSALYEEILERPDLAIEDYRAILVLAPGHGPTLRNLERLYEETEQYEPLAEVLRVHVDSASGPDQIDLKFRLGQLLERCLNQVEGSVDEYEAILLRQPTHLRSQEALSNLLASPTVRARVAAILEPIYESQGAYHELCRVLEIQLEADELDVVARCELLLRVGHLYESRLRDPDAAMAAYAKAFETDPTDDRGREALARLSVDRDPFRRRRAEVLTTVLAKLPKDDWVLRASLLLELAGLLDEFLDEQQRAKEAYEELLVLAGDDPELALPAARALQRIHAERGEHSGVALNLERQLHHETQVEDQLSYLSQLAALYEEQLGQPEKALERSQQVLALDPTDGVAADRVCRLLRASGQHRELVQALRTRAEVSQDAEQRWALSLEAAQLLEGVLGDKAAAIDAYNEVILAHGPDPVCLHALSGLYEDTGAYSDLLDVLQQLAALAEGHEGEAGRGDLHCRMADVMRLQTGDLHGAIGLYESVLIDDSGHAGSLAGLDALMAEGQELDVRLEAARVAAARYEAEGDAERLLAVLEVQAINPDAHNQVLTLRRAAEVAEEGLATPSVAFDYLARALAVDPHHPDVAAIFTELQRLAQHCERYGDLVQVLSRLADALFDEDLKVAVFRAIGETAEGALQEPSRAQQAYRDLLELRPDDTAALCAMERLTEAAGDHVSLLQVLRQRADLEADSEARFALLMRKADIHERLDELSEAVAVLEDLALESPQLETFAALERLYGTMGRFADLVDVFERQLEVGVGEPAELRYRIGATSYHQLQDVPRALASLKDALAVDADHRRSVALLETLMEDGGGEFCALAAETLEPGYLARMEWSKLTRALTVQLDASDDMEKRRRLLVRLAQIHEDQLEDFSGTFHLYGRLFKEDPYDEEVWDRLARLAKVDGRFDALAQVLTDALGDEPIADGVMAKLAIYVGKVYDERLARPAAAAPFYRRALEFDPAHGEAFTDLESCYLRAGDQESLMDLYRQLADMGPSELRSGLLHKRAGLLSGLPGREPEAIDAYRELLELDPADRTATVSLDDLLCRSGDMVGLADHLRHRVEYERDEAAAISLKLRLSELLRTALDDLDGAIDILEDITTVYRGQPDALAVLEALVQESQQRKRLTDLLEPIYRHLDQWKKLIAVHEAQVELQQDAGEQVRLLADIGELHESRGGDLLLALDAYGRALALEPDNGLIREQVERLAAAAGACELQVGIFEQALANATDGATRALLLGTLARVHDEQRGDPRAAIAAYEALAEIDPTDPEPLDALQPLLMMVSDWEGLVKVFERKIEHCLDAVERGELLRRVASVYEDLLNDQERAIATYVRAVEEDDADVLAYEALDRLYTQRSAAEPLGGVLRRRLEVAFAPEERVELGLRLGALLHHHLHEPDEAIGVYQRVLDDDNENGAAILELSRLFERQGRWAELADNLRQQVALAGEVEVRAELLAKLANIYLDALADPVEAAECHVLALQEQPQFEPSVTALMGLAADDGLRGRIIEVLEPLLRTQLRYDDLVQLAELALSGMTDSVDRRDQLVAIAELHERGRGAQGDAFVAYGRALAEDPADGALHRELERLAQQGGLYSQLAALFEQEAADLAEPRDASLLLRHAGRIYEEALADDEAAIRALTLASERDDDATETLFALDRLYRRTERWEELLEVLDRRIAVTAEEDERVLLLLRAGELRERHFDDVQGAFVAYREVLELRPAEPQALAGLERIGENELLAQDVLDILQDTYRQMGIPEKVVGLYDIRARLAATTAERVRVLREAAVIWEQELHDPPRALTTLGKAFEVDPLDDDVLMEMERVAADHQAFAHLRGFLEGVVERGGEVLDELRARELCLRAADWYRERLLDTDAEERMLRRVLIEHPGLPEVQERLLELVRSPGREADLVPALCAWARAEDDLRLRAERYREAAEVAEHVLGDQITAVECLQSVLAAEPDDLTSLETLLRLCEGLGRHDELATLLEQRISWAVETDERQELLGRLAALYRGPLADPEQAIVVYERLLQEQPGARETVDALVTLLDAVGRHDALSTLLEQRLTYDEDPEVRIDTRVRLATLRERQFGDAQAAIEQLRGVLLEAPGHHGAFFELVRLYEAGERYPDLALLLRNQVALASEAMDREVERQCLEKLCQLYEGPLRDRDNARQGYERLHALQPDNEGHLRALVRLYGEAGQWAEVADSLDSLLGVLDHRDAIDVVLQLADVARRYLRDLPRAEQALRLALSIDPERAAVRDKLRECYSESGATAQLVELLVEDEARLSEPLAKAALLKQIAELYSGPLGQPQAAVGYLEQAQALSPDDRGVLLALCDIYMAADRHGDAVPVLERIIASYGGRRAKEVAVYEHRLGLALEGLGRIDDAFTHYDAAFKIDLTNVAILRDLGRICMQRNDLEQAQKRYRALLLQRLSPEAGIRKADVYFYLGQICHRQGSVDKARAMLQRAVSEAGEYPEAAELLAKL